MTDPLWPLDALFGASDDAVLIDSEAVRDVPVTRCRLTVDLARADAALPAGVSVPSGPYRSLAALPVQVWLDAAGLARRISVCSEPTDAADKQVWSIVELWDFGVAVDITPPRPRRFCRRQRPIASLTKMPGQAPDPSGADRAGQDAGDI